jgi:hypothetical protein
MGACYASDMAKYGDILVGLFALIYTIIAVVLKDMDISDLGEYIAQPALSGPFAVAALTRGWTSLKAKVKADVEAKKSDEGEDKVKDGDEKKGGE